jgi:hypothetical protein
LGGAEWDYDDFFLSGRKARERYASTKYSTQLCISTFSMVRRPWVGDAISIAIRMQTHKKRRIGREKKNILLSLGAAVVLPHCIY